MITLPVPANDNRPQAARLWLGGHTHMVTAPPRDPPNPDNDNDPDPWGPQPEDPKPDNDNDEPSEDC